MGFSVLSPIRTTVPATLHTGGWCEVVDCPDAVIIIDANFVKPIQLNEELTRAPGGQFTPFLLLSGFILLLLDGATLTVMQNTISQKVCLEVCLIEFGTLQVDQQGRSLLLPRKGRVGLAKARSGI